MSKATSPPAVCLVFQVHQPRRLQRFTVFDDGSYFDDELNRRLMQRIAGQCYVPMFRLLTELIERGDAEFCIGMSLTGCVIEQFKKYAPLAIEQLTRLVQTGRCELLGETSHHSLAYLADNQEFNAQIDLHAAAIGELLGSKPTTFRGTELIYSNDLAARLVKRGGYTCVLAEGVDKILAGRSAHQVLRSPGEQSMALLLRDYELSDDVAFRFTDRSMPGWPLTADKYARKLRDAAGDAGVVNLFMDIETFGEHHSRASGIFDFLANLPGQAQQAGLTFAMPGQLAERCTEQTPIYDCPTMTSWADTERDLSAWLGNAMQTSASSELYRLRSGITASGDQRLLAHWRDLSTSDHFYYMCTKYYEDQAVHRYFNPYDSPYDSYINFMNVLDDMREKIGASQPKPAGDGI